MGRFDIYEHIQPNEIPSSSDIALIADLCGIETALKIAKALPGCSLYIPTSKAFKQTKIRVIKAFMRQGVDIKRISYMLGISDRQVRKYLESV